MNKKSEYNNIELSIILVAVLVASMTIYFISEDDSLTGYATRITPENIELIELNQTEKPVIIEKPIEIETPIDIESTQPEEQEQPIEIQAGCTTPTSGMTINSNTTFCSGTYYLNEAYFPSLGDSMTILINKSYITLDCNNSIIIGDNTGTGLKTSTAPSVNNVNIKNCVFMNYSIPIYILGQSILNSHNIVLENVNVSGGRGVANILVEGCDDCVFRNIDSSNALNISANPLPPHGIYISGGTGLRTGNNVLIENSIFNNNIASGIRVSDQNGRHHNNLTIKNTIMSNNVGAGLVINACKDCTINNNYITENGNRGISIGTTTITESDNILIENNTFSGNANNDYILWGSKNIVIRNNIYTSNSASINIRSENLSNYSILENSDDLLISYQNSNPYSPSASVTLSYSGFKEFSFTNNNLTFNLVSVYNDIKNVSNNEILASNIDEFNIALNANQHIQIGNYVVDPIQNNTSPVLNSVSLLNNLTCIINATDADNDSLTITIEWYLNNTLNKTGSSITQTNYTGTHYCKARAYDGLNYSGWVSSNNITINASIPNNNLILSNIVLDSDLNCSGNVNMLSNITVDYYLNDTLNNTFELDNINGSFDVQTNAYNGTWYCNITATNGLNTTSEISNSVIITPVIPSNTPPIVTVSLSNNLTCSGTVSESVNATILFYKNGAVANTTVLETNNTFSVSNANSSGVWYCQVSASDGINTTISNSNTITISTSDDDDSSSSGGGGGGGGGSIYVQSEDLKNNNTTLNTTSQDSSNPDVESDRVPNESSIGVDLPVAAIPNVTPPITESPTRDSVGRAFEVISSLAKKNTMPYMIIILLFVVLSVIIVKSSKPVIIDDKLNTYIIKSLQNGYSYAAIRTALRKHYSPTIIDHHFFMLRRNNYKPITAQQPQKTFSNRITAINSIIFYIKQQKNLGYKEKDIKKVLMQNGYPKDLIMEALKNA